jgi:tetratricopeptide (TPR) repeat protein
MAPEQAQGHAVDVRTDLFSLGSVLYEMATGRRAFGGDNVPLILMKIINGIVVPARAINETIPQTLDDIIQKLMSVDPKERYQTAAELLRAIDEAIRQVDLEAESAEPIDAAPSGVPMRSGRFGPRAILAAAAAVVVLAGAVVAAWIARRAPVLTDRDSIVMGRFENTTSDPVFNDTLSAALKAHLGQSPFLDIVPDQRITETLQLMARRPDERLTHQVAREVCQRLGVKAMLEGFIASLGSHYVVTLMATDCQSGESLARAQAEAPSKERVLSELGRISSSIRTALGESLPSIQRFDVPIEQATTPSLAALNAYALGLEERRRGREIESIAFFNQAIENDPEFASAYTTLSTVYGSIGEWRRSEEFARLANNVKRRVSERERLFITYQYHDRVTGNEEEAARTLEIWKTAYPRDFRPANALALIGNRLGRYDDAISEAQEALRRSPGHPFPLSNLAFAYRALGRYDEAKKTAEEAVKLGVETTPTRRLLYQIGLMTGDPSAAAHLAWAKGKPREFDLVSAQAQAAAFDGRLHQAAELYDRAIDLALARGLKGTASGYSAHLAWTNALYRVKDAAATVKRIIARVDDEADAPGTVPRFRAGAALGLSGAVSEAQALLARAAQRYPESSLVRAVLVPSTRAAIALHQSRPNDAIQALRAATPAEMGSIAGLIPLYLRAEAYLQRGSFNEAVAEYDQILQHRGIDPLAPVVPLAHLGVARAKAGLGDAEGSRRAYQELFTIWKGADADFAPLVAARAEYARLQTH